MKRFISGIITVGLLIGCISSTALAVDNSTATPQIDISTEVSNPQVIEKSKYEVLADKLVPTVVSIRVTYLGYNSENGTLVPQGAVFGSGVFISDSGHVLTCAHLFEHRYIDSVTIMTHSQEVVIGKILYVSHEKDLALLKSAYDFKDLQYAKVSSRMSVKRGEEVLAIGHPLSLGWSVTNGIISGLDRFLRRNQKTIQTNAVINPGNSGGPLFDMNGHVIGINVMLTGTWGIPMWSGQGFAVAPDEINNFLDLFRGL